MSHLSKRMKEANKAIGTIESPLSLQEAVNRLAKASGTAGKEVIGSLTVKQVEEIAKMKMDDLNTIDMSEAIATVSGTARSMGIEVKG